MEYTVNLGKEGRILIPAALRQQLGLKANDALTVSVVDGELRVSRRVDAIRRMQKRLARLRDPRNPAVDELLRERHADTASE